MRTERFIAENIAVPAGHRALDPAKVDEIAQSINQVGLLHPIIVYYRSDPDTLELVSGAHRLAAVIKLGWDMVPCLVVESDDPLHRELVEIDENLARNDLTIAERALYTARRAAVWERLKATAGISGPTWATNSVQARKRVRPKEANLGFAADTARKRGRPKSTTNRDMKRGRSIPPDVLSDVHGTSLDKGVELDALAEMPTDDQRQLAAKAKAGEKVSARKPVQDEAAAYYAWKHELDRVFMRGSREWQQRWLASTRDEPVGGRT